MSVLRYLLTFAGMACLLAGSPVQGEVSLASLLEEMVSLDAPARWPQPAYLCKQASSYDRAEMAPDKPGWFANHDFSQYIRAEQNQGRVEMVMLDADGPGSLVRFWLTTTRNKTGVLRIYLDDHAAPDVSFPAYDLLSGDLKLAAPLDQPHPGYHSTENGGNTLMLPIPYAQHCKVTGEEAGDGPRYYQIDYRTYASDTPVQTFSKNVLAAARPLIAQVEKQLAPPTAGASLWERSLNQTVLPGKTDSLALPAGPAAANWLELQVDPANPVEIENALRSTIVQMQFDGENTVWCPASDFFGSGAGLNALQSWYRTVQTDGMMVCRWVMPYAASARVSISNAGEHPVKINLHAGIQSWHWDNRSLHFHGTWHYEAGLVTSPPRDWTCIHIAGRGVYLGDTLALYNPVATWYGEGDEKIRVDDEALPSFLGTGTEDYYDFSFAPRGLMQTPFASQVRVDQPTTRGNNVLTRTRNLDGIPFTKSLNFDFELISWQPTRLLYAMTTYWYAFPGATCNLHPQPQAAALPVPILIQ